MNIYGTDLEINNRVGGGGVVMSNLLTSTETCGGLRHAAQIFNTPMRQREFKIFTAYNSTFKDVSA
jgi:hypothetical protein